MRVADAGVVVLGADVVEPGSIWPSNIPPPEPAAPPMFGGGVIFVVVLTVGEPGDSVVVVVVVVVFSAFAVVDGTVDGVTWRVVVAGNGGAISPNSGISMSANGGHILVVVVGAAVVVEDVSGTPGSTAGAA
ncbi:MAG: hypothetical protein LLG14_04835 [Nocardiaceae bacterium]|nr:hypothetical protein [Nocardiaceae bacterium]